MFYVLVIQKVIVKLFFFFPECLTMRRQTAQRQKGEFTRSFDIHILLLLYGQTARERPDIRLSGYPAFLYPDGYSVYLI